MKTIRLENNVVTEIIPEYALPVETWYGSEFAAKCVEAPDTVAQGWKYDAETKTFLDPSVRSVEELRAAALERISGKCSAAIYTGVTVDGKHYRLQETDQLSLNAAIGLANSGTSISYAADGETGKTMTAAEIAAVGKAAYDWGYVCRSYYGLLKVWIARETDRAVLAGIDFGSKLPDDLMQQLAALLSSAGIDITKYSGMFTA